MNRRRRSGQRLICVSAVALYLGFVVAAALPGLVFCHRSGGRVAVEIAGPAGVCSCEECEHCRERLAGPRSGARPDGPVLEACHCSHEPIMIAADRSALRRDDGFRSPETAGSMCLSPTSVAAPGGTILSAAAGLSPPGFPTFPGGTRLLRC